MTLLDNLQGYWKMNEASWNGTANEVIDSSNKNRHGLATGVNTAVGGIFDRMALFDGTSSNVITMGNVTEISGHDHFSAQCWVKVEDGDMDSFCVFVNLLDQFQIDSGPNTGVVRFIINIGSSWITDAVSTTTIDDGNFHHIVCVYDGAKTHIYIDGAEEGTGWSHIGNITSPGAKPLLVSYGGYAMTGGIDEVAVWDRVVSSAEVTTLYNSGAGHEINTSLTSNLEGYWKLNETSWDGTLNEVIDYSGNDYHAAATNGAADTTTGGIMGNRCGRFTGTLDYEGVFNGTMPGFAGQSNLTVQMWIRENETDGFTDHDSCLMYLDQNIVVEIGNVYVSRFIQFWFNLHDDSGYPDWVGGVEPRVDLAGGKWHHIVGTLSPSNVRTYIDGTEIGDGYSQRWDGEDIIPIELSNAYLDTPNDPGISIGFTTPNTFKSHADICEVAIWNRTLTQTEITKLYNNGKGINIITGKGVSPLPTFFRS